MKRFIDWVTESEARTDITIALMYAAAITSCVMAAYAGYSGFFN